MIEPGRSIVGNAGVTLYKCSQIKKTYGRKQYLFIDGGMADNIRPALYDAVNCLVVVNKMMDPKEVLVDVVGKCCESGDFIIKDALLPVSKPGDYLAVFQTGAYNYSMHVEYNGHLRPAVVFVSDEVKVVSKKQTIDNILELFK